MLNFRNTSIAFLVMLALFSVLSIYSVLGYLLLAALAVAYLALLISGSVFVCSGYYLKAFCKKETGEKVMALTFDDGPHPVITPKVLDILNRHGIKAMFFVIGKNVTHNQQVMERMVKEGHAVGNHSYSHANLFDLWNSKQMLRDVNRAEDTIALACGQRPGWFRPPFGVTNPAVAVMVSQKNINIMGWSVRSLDTSIKEPGKIIDRIKRRWHPGGIILLHDTSEKVLEVLEKVIEYAEKEDYRFVRADRM